jgi:hypothetical protein
MRIDLRGQLASLGAAAVLLVLASTGGAVVGSLITGSASSAHPGTSHPGRPAGPTGFGHLVVRTAHIPLADTATSASVDCKSTEVAVSGGATYVYDSGALPTIRLSVPEFDGNPIASGHVVPLGSGWTAGIIDANLAPGKRVGGTVYVECATP